LTHDTKAKKASAKLMKVKLDVIRSFISTKTHDIHENAQQNSTNGTKENNFV